jgi:peptide/nickel transport system permease protein
MRYIARRLAFYAVAFWGALTLNFLLPRLMPGKPIDYFMNRYRFEIQQNPHFLDSLKIELGSPKESMPVQYVHYLGNMLHGDFGIAYSAYPSPVTSVIGATLPWTLFLAGMATVLAFAIGTLLGAVVAWRRGGVLDSILPPITLFTSAFPSFFLALLLLYGLGLKLDWFPLQHAYGSDTTAGLNLPYIKDVLYHAALPVIVIVLTSMGGWLLGMRNVMINTLAEDYIAMAHAKGLKDRRVMFMYAARNAMLPNITGFAIALGYIVGGVTLVETVFSYPGVGFTLVNAALGSDYPTVQALLFLISVCVLGANFLVDILYVWLDPRARAQ